MVIHTHTHAHLYILYFLTIKFIGNILIGFLKSQMSLPSHSHSYSLLSSITYLPKYLLGYG